MQKIDLNQLKKLREETQASVADCRRALEETNGDYRKALEWIRKHGIEKAGKKEGRETKAGVVESYTHHNLTSGSTVVLTCETDFVGRTEEFKNLAHEIAMQVNALNPKDVKALLSSAYIRDEKKTIQELIKEFIAKLGENIEVKEFKRFEV
ncbi:MAG TPA: translation elongation factor Ts [Patescibacteria group bacterium]|nr:translation elongation factor Ts [Patescibacteria group bacterium]